MTEGRCSDAPPFFMGGRIRGFALRIFRPNLLDSPETARGTAGGGAEA